MSDSDEDDADLGRLADDDVDSGRDLGQLVDDDIELGRLVDDDLDLDIDLSRLDDPNDVGALGLSLPAIEEKKGKGIHTGEVNKRKADVLLERGDDSDFLALVRSHDQRQLRVGDQVTFTEASGNKYDLAAAIRDAMKSLGATVPHALRDTSHGLDVLAVVGASHHKYECETISGLMKSLKHGLSPYLVVMIGWDSTPRTMEFGSLAELVAPLARYSTPRDGAMGWHCIVCWKISRKHLGYTCIYNFCFTETSCLICLHTVDK